MTSEIGVTQLTPWLLHTNKELPQIKWVFPQLKKYPDIKICVTPINMQVTPDNPLVTPDKYRVTPDKMGATPIKKVTPYKIYGTPFNTQVTPNNTLVTPDKIYSITNNTTHNYPQIKHDQSITLKGKIAQTTCAVIEPHPYPLHLPYNSAND